MPASTLLLGILKQPGRVWLELANSLPSPCLWAVMLTVLSICRMSMLRLRYAYAMPLLSYNCLPQLRPALRTELGGAIGLGAAVGAELMDASGGRGEG